MVTFAVSPAATGTFAKPFSSRSGPHTPSGAVTYSWTTSVPSTAEVLVTVRCAPVASTLSPEYSKLE